MMACFKVPSDDKLVSHANRNNNNLTQIKGRTSKNITNQLYQTSYPLSTFPYFLKSLSSCSNAALIINKLSLNAKRSLSDYKNGF